MANILSKEIQAQLRSEREPLRALIVSIRKCGHPTEREHVTQALLMALGFRNSTEGRKPRTSVRMNAALRTKVLSYPKLFTDREIAQIHNLAIGDVSNVRRNTRR